MFEQARLGEVEEEPEAAKADAAAAQHDCRPRHERLSAVTGEERSPEEQANVVDDAIPPEAFGSAAVRGTTEPKSIYERYRHSEEIPYTD